MTLHKPFGFADVGFDGQKIAPAFTVGKEGCFPFTVSGIDGHSDAAETFGGVFREGFDVGGDVLGHSHEMPAAFAGIFPKLRRKCEFQIDQSL